MQGRDGVVMLISALVIEQGAMLHHLLDQRKSDVSGRSIPFGRFTNAICRQFQDIESDTCIAIGKDGYLFQGIFINGQIELTQAALLICQSSMKNSQNLLFAQTLQGENATAR